MGTANVYYPQFTELLNSFANVRNAVPASRQAPRETMSAIEEQTKKPFWLFLNQMRRKIVRLTPHVPALWEENEELRPSLVEMSMEFIDTVNIFGDYEQFKPMNGTVKGTVVNALISVVRGKGFSANRDFLVPAKPAHMKSLDYLAICAFLIDASVFAHEVLDLHDAEITDFSIPTELFDKIMSSPHYSPEPN